MTGSTSIVLVAIVAFSILHSVLASPKVVSLPFEKHQRKSAPALRRRQDFDEIPIDNEQILYYVNVTVGKPPQTFSLQLDTGSSDTWVPAVSSDICTENGGFACSAGAFDASESTTFERLTEDAFQTFYADGSEVQGDYFSDTIEVADSFKLENLTMALASNASRGVGVMGLGPSAGESIAVQDPDLVYPNIIDQIVQQGITNTRAYSLYLNHADADNGNILFGGVDTNKYSGDLIGLPIHPDAYPDLLTSFTVAFTGLSLTDASGRSLLTREEIAIPAIIDSGATHTYLPDDIANDILQGLGVTSDPAFGNLVRCQVGQEEATFLFEFGGEGGPAIEVELSHLITPLLALDSSALTFDDGAEACSFGIYAAAGGPVFLGDSFMRSAYVVYDLENDLIALAQASYDSPDSNIQEFSEDETMPRLASIVSDVKITETYSGALPSAPPTGTAMATQVQGTERSATFRFGEATGEASETTDAAPATVAPIIEATTAVAGVLVLTSIIFGGAFLLYV